ncbi:MAG: hypothetical protein IPK82_08835 [Polyangiaceae bacterium]|nr:hypothetical protein [Polyangiaceae bacterium]
MRSRPDIDLQLPRVIYPGDELVVGITLTSHSITPIEFFDITLSGNADSNVAMQDNSSVSRSKRIVQATQRLREACTLEEGELTFEVRFSLPRDAPATYAGTAIQVRYELRAHISIPWWPDLRETWELLVENRGAQRPAPAPSAVKSVGDGPFVEISVTDTNFAPGDEINGAFAAGNVPKANVDGIEVSLVALERIEQGDGRTFQVEQNRHNIPNVFHLPPGGKHTPFRFRVPKESYPSFQALWFKLDYRLVVILRMHNGVVSTHIPVKVGKYAAPRAQVGRLPDVGIARWRTGWASAGAKYGFLLNADQFGLVGTRGPVNVAVEVYESDHEAAMVAVFTYPSLNLDLHVEPQVLIVLPSKVELRYPGYKINQRDIAQTRVFLDEPLRSALLRFKIQSMSDTELTVRGPVKGYDAEAIDPFLKDVSGILDALGQAIEAIPPPPELAESLPDWRVFAGRTGASLSVGGMVLQGITIEGGLFQIETLFQESGAVSLTRVSLTIDPPLPIAHTLDPGQPSTFASAAPGSIDLAQALRAKCRRVQVTADTLSIDIPGPVSNPEELRPLFVEMFTLARRLKNERAPGPYR